MADATRSSTAPRRPRADAERNRVRLLEAAKAAFTDSGANAGMEDIARRAGVGIGTLYRHFPTRDAIVQAVYRNEVQQIAEAATRLLETEAPVEALRAWMRLFVDYIATKKIIAPALAVMAGGTSELFAASGPQIKQAMALLVARAVASGDVRAETEPMDLLYALGGFTNANTGPDWAASARRLIDILVAGLRK